MHAGLGPHPLNECQGRGNSRELWEFGLPQNLAALAHLRPGHSFGFMWKRILKCNLDRVPHPWRPNLQGLSVPPLPSGRLHFLGWAHHLSALAHQPHSLPTCLSLSPKACLSLQETPALAGRAPNCGHSQLLPKVHVLPNPGSDSGQWKKGPGVCISNRLPEQIPC